MICVGVMQVTLWISTAKSVWLKLNMLSFMLNLTVAASGDRISPNVSIDVSQFRGVKEKDVYTPKSFDICSTKSR
jgi:hypothetical protein